MVIDLSDHEEEILNHLVYGAALSTDPHRFDHAMVHLKMLGLVVVVGAKYVPTASGITTIRDLRLADIAKRIRYAADMVGDAELPSQLHGLARELENLV
jgi:uncharacterized protein (UPF0254 family)